MKIYSSRRIIKHGQTLFSTALASCGYKTSATTTVNYKAALIAVAGLLVPGIVLLTAVFSPRVSAQTPNTTLNYQARLLTSTGALVPDGN